MNKAGAKGVPIPIIDGVQLIEPQIVLGDGVVRVDADVKYSGARRASVVSSHRTVA